MNGLSTDRNIRPTASEHPRFLHWKSMGKSPIIVWKRDLALFTPYLHPICSDFEWWDSCRNRVV